jgi:hypothetical protein
MVVPLIPRFARWASLVLATSLVLAACGGPSVEADASDKNPVDIESTYDVTYTDGTTVIDTDEATTQLISASDDGRTFRFHPTDSLRNLAVGEVAIFGGVGFGRVTEVREQSGELVIETAEASLGDAIQDGEISWSYPVRWDQLPEASYRHAARTMAASFVEQNRTAGAPRAALAMAHSAPDSHAVLADDTGLTDGLSYSGTVEGFEVSVTLKPEGSRLNIDLTASRKLPAGTGMKATVTGWVAGFTQETFLRYEDSTPTELTSKALGVESELELKWSAAKIGEALTEVSSFKLPVSLPIPFAIGPIPVIISIGANLQVVPELSVDQASSGGSYKVKYRSDQGFEISGSSDSAIGTLLSSDIGVSGETVSAGFGVVAFALGVEFPRMELSFFGTTSVFITLKTYSTSQWTPGTTLTSDIPPCQMGTTTIAAYAGYKLALLGFTLGEKTEELWKTDYEKFKDDKPCSLTGD